MRPKFDFVSCIKCHATHYHNPRWPDDCARCMMNEQTEKARTERIEAERLPALPLLARLMADTFGPRR